jgi:hypothetical protein
VRVWLLLFALAAACGGDGGSTVICFGCSFDSSIDNGGSTLCSPLSQTGCQANEKCTWIVDATVPQYVGHIGCVPDGTALIGAACMYGAAGATGYDNCAKGGVCSAYETPMTAGVCKQICDDQGGNPMCDSTHACVTDPMLFSTGATSPQAAGACEPTCDPLADNDFDGSGSAFARTGSACGSAENGCYGMPKTSPPATAFTCMSDLNYTIPLRHRSECTSATECADRDGTIHINSCNQGYEPLLNESTGNSTIVCVALCAPLDCYMGSCGSNDENRLGSAPHRCNSSDAVGSFGSDEECQYLWAHELGIQWLRSAYSDSVGICVDHAAYGWPSCKDVPLHGSGSAVDAVALGCVSSQTAGL